MIAHRFDTRIIWDEEIVKQEIEQVVYKPKLEQKAVSFILGFTLIILGVLGWIAYESYNMKKEPILQLIILKSAYFKEGWGCYPLEYKDW